MHEIFINRKIDKTQTNFQKMKNRAKNILKICILRIVRSIPLQDSVHTGVSYAF